MLCLVVIVDAHWVNPHQVFCAGTRPQANETDSDGPYPGDGAGVLTIWDEEGG
jgi:hypothetical protein